MLSYMINYSVRCMVTSDMYFNVCYTCDKSFILSHLIFYASIIWVVPVNIFNVNLHCCKITQKFGFLENFTRTTLYIIPFQNHKKSYMVTFLQKHGSGLLSNHASLSPGRQKLADSYKF